MYLKKNNSAVLSFFHFLLKDCIKHFILDVCRKITRSLFSFNKSEIEKTQGDKRDNLVKSLAQSSRNVVQCIINHFCLIFITLLGPE